MINPTRLIYEAARINLASLLRFTYIKDIIIENWDTDETIAAFKMDLCDPARNLPAVVADHLGCEVVSLRTVDDELWIGIKVQ